MKKKVKAELEAGHQEDAVEVPFDPVEVWGIAPGRFGADVKAIESWQQ